MSGRVLKRDAAFLREKDSLTDRLFVKGDRVPDEFEAGDHLFTEEPDWESPQTGHTGSGLILPGVPADDNDADDDGDDDGDPLIAGSIEDVLDRVGDDPDKATAALAAEQASEKPRKGVVEGLTKVIDNAGS